MSLELIISLIVAITGLIGTVWGIVKYYDKKNSKRQAQEQQEKQKLNATLETISGKLENITEDNNKQHKEIGEIKESMTAVNERVDTLKQQIQNTREEINENEMDRLRSDIIDCVNRLQNGSIMSQADLEHIHHAYDKYKKRGGNSYIESCMHYVIEYEDECRRNGIDMDFNHSEM